MVNLEHKLTVDDLIVEYMMEKVKNGYEPHFTISEFMKFLSYFQEKYEVEDALDNGKELFQRFFERKKEHDWASISDWETFDKQNSPHMEMEYDSNSDEYIIKANYKLSDYDRSIINTYFMDNGMGKFDDYNGKTNRTRTVIREFLSANCEKRKLEEVEYDENEELIGKAFAAQIITCIWGSYIDEKIKHRQWPVQCRYINKYLLDIDLARIIGVESIKDELLELYKVLSKRISSMYHQDHNLKISTYKNGYLARANYDLLITGYEERMNKTFGPHKKNLDIDASTSSLTESHELDGVYDYDDEPDIKATIIKAKNEKIKRIIKELDKNIKK